MATDPVLSVRFEPSTAERWLGSALFYRDLGALREALSLLTPRMFEPPAVRTVFEAAAEVIRRGETPDVDLLAAELGPDRLEEVGGVRYLSNLAHAPADFDPQPVPLAKALRLEYSDRRAREQLRDAADSGSSLGELLADLEELSETIRQEVGSTGRTEIATLAELQARPELLEPPPCVVPRIAFRGRLTLLAGPDKCGKSTLLAHAVAALTHGDRFLGDPMGARHRRAVWAGLEEAVGDGVRRFHDLRAAGEGIRLVVSPSRSLLDHLDASLSREPGDLVVVDSLAEYARVTCGVAPEDGDTAAWGAIVRPLVALARRHEVAVVVLHHVRRSDGEYRGAGEIAAAADLLLEMKRPGAGEDPSMRRLGGRGRWEVEGFAVALREDRYELAGGTPLSRDALVLIHVEHNPGCSMNDVCKTVTGRKQVVQDTVRELVARGAIENRGSEDEWALYPVLPQTDLGVT